ncbi:P-loop containing nucleoside triphosphate hydrolase protein [Fimicolochytrium jonesii]|uniref:P-loop containing nucleoside triphosphate hydrolase protein n=1 Tax=Fimicolochytrium jonesii TaxID=1396493 RepID=UPI0022FEF5F8|nr:P-loop containing nucleoside triphosphate hydrolase protein [Fimicolochytrium jonesii]KAI8819646.1 P-loop containing nucleoside triphosphate hydrolase protein [Fimicolochytrium jonesii]
MAEEEGPEAVQAPSVGPPTGTQPSRPQPSTIQIYARVRPARPNSKLRIDPNRYVCNSSETEKPRIGFLIPKDEAAGMVNNQREAYDFQFDRVFDMGATQEEVFDVVAKPVALSAMDGYNGTIFAYGQTGSGKTFTITGGAERYSDRGIIPRTLQFIFKEMSKRHDIQYEVSISYLEIYNELAYDLLDSTREAKKLEDLPKVSLQEDEQGNVHLGNLSCVPAKNEEEALNLLFIGDTTRMIAETPSNPSSSRSHCLFIISLLAKREGDATIRRSKLHLVDLAGSERVARTGINGTLLKEAKYINLSLHYLEQVIIALHEKALGKRTHIPYRNSVMTTVLRDSLGGNCRTTMVATVAVEDVLIDESISTCRFAQRVALISNNATLNEELDPHLLIARLKREVARLKVELAIARGETGDQSDELPAYEIERLRVAVNDYLRDNSKDASLLFADSRKTQEAFRIMKEMVRSGGSASPDTDQSRKPALNALSPTNDSTVDTNEVQRLARLLAHRDNEINVLVGMVNKLRSGQDPRSQPLKTKDLVPSHQSSPSLLESAAPSISSQPASTTASVNGLNSRLRASVPQLTSEKAKAFEIFKQGYPSGEWIEGQKTLLKGKYNDAKALGEKANQLRTEIKTMKSKIGEDASDPDELADLRKTVVDRSARYKESYQQLKDLKLEIEHLQHLLEQARHRLTRDFEHWYANVYLATAEDMPPERDRMPPDDVELRSRSSSVSSFAASSSNLAKGSKYGSLTELSDQRQYQPSSMRQQDVGGGGMSGSRTASMDTVTRDDAHVTPRDPPVLPKYVYPSDLQAQPPRVASNTIPSRQPLPDTVPWTRASPAAETPWASQPALHHQRYSSTDTTTTGMSASTLNDPNPPYRMHRDFSTGSSSTPTPSAAYDPRQLPKQRSHHASTSASDITAAPYPSYRRAPSPKLSATASAILRTPPQLLPVGHAGHNPLASPPPLLPAMQKHHAAPSTHVPAGNVQEDVAEFYRMRNSMLNRIGKVE